MRLQPEIMRTPSVGTKALDLTRSSTRNRRTFSSGVDCYLLLQDRGLKFKALCKHNEDPINPSRTGSGDACGSPGKRGLAAKLVWHPLAFAVVRHPSQAPKSGWRRRLVPFNDIPGSAIDDFHLTPGQGCRLVRCFPSLGKSVAHHKWRASGWADHENLEHSAVSPSLIITQRLRKASGNKLTIVTDLFQLHPKRDFRPHWEHHVSFYAPLQSRWLNQTETRWPSTRMPR